MVDHIAIAQRQSVSAERKRAGQVASQQKWAQREDERNAKRGGGGRMPSARGRRAPQSASQFHFTKKYSNRAGKNRAPSSALKKLAYDFRLTLIDADGREVHPGKHDGDLDYSYTSTDSSTPKDALDLAKLAQESERSAGRQSRSRQMAHYDVALPNDLTEEGRRALARKIADDTRQRMDNVPIFVALHAPDRGNGNWHIHISHSLRRIIKVDDDGAFRMGDRIMHEQRPSVRQVAGLSKTNHDEMKAHRAATSELIAQALDDEGHDSLLAGRWRHGHLRLAQQVDHAAKRGDVQFVIDNHSRPATWHEGPGAHHGKFKNAATEHNKDVATSIDAALLTRAMINRVLETSQRLGIHDPEHLRMLGRDMGLLLHWSKDRESGLVRGAQWQIVGGPRLAGAAVGCPLGDLKRRMQWAETPVYKRVADRQGEAFEAYRSILDQHGKGKFAGRGVSILDRVINAQAQEREAAIAAAETAAQASDTEQPRRRPKRPSSKTCAAQVDSLNPRKVTKEPPIMDANVIKNLMSDLSRLPDEPTAAATSKDAPPPRLRPPTKEEIDSLTEAERQFLRDRYDDRAGGMDFKSPARDAQDRVESLWLELQRINDKEPLDHDVRFVEVKRLFRKPEMQESPALLEWQEQQAQALASYDQAYSKAASNFRKIYRDPELFAMLPAFRAEQTRMAQENERLAAERHDNLVRRNREHNRGYVTGERQDDDRRNRDRGG